MKISRHDEDVLDNLVWHALTTTQRGFSLGDGPVRRYDPALTVFAGLENDGRAAWDALAALMAPEESVAIFRAEPVEVTGGWCRVGGGVADQMLATNLEPAVAIDESIVELRAGDAAQMLALAQMAEPGPFLARTRELGDFYGVFDDDGELLAMAGERMRTERFTEVSAVCTHPRARGRGLAAALTRRVAGAIAARGQIPVLHVAHGNDGAKRIYQRLGFVVRRSVRFTAVRFDG